MPQNTISPYHSALNFFERIRRQANGQTLSEKVLQPLWMEVFETSRTKFAGHNVAWQWLRLRSSIRRIDREQTRLAEAGNLGARQMQHRIRVRTNDSIVESARRLVVSQAIDDEIDAGGQTMARMLHTAADEPDLAHALLEGKIMPLADVLAEVERFGCQHEIEIVKLRPVGARLADDTWITDFER